MAKIELKFMDLAQKLTEANTYVVLLEAEDKKGTLPIMLNPAEFEQMKSELIAHRDGRDTLAGKCLEMIKMMGGRLVEMELVHFEHGKCTAKLTFENGGTTHDIEISSAEALTIHGITNIPVMIDEELLSGQYTRLNKGGMLSMPVDKVCTDMLEAALRDAVKEENYEYASKLRDEINSRK